jgi:DNA polymerase II
MEDTRLPIALEGVYRWIAFLSSKQDYRIPVPNRYFGVFQDGTIKARGIESRRRDTPVWIANTQIAILETLAKADKLEDVYDLIPVALSLLHREWQEFCAGCVPLESLLLSQRLGRELVGISPVPL